jgi:hypothetical protein
MNDVDRANLCLDTTTIWADGGVHAVPESWWDRVSPPSAQDVLGEKGWLDQLALAYIQNTGQSPV